MSTAIERLAEADAFRSLGLDRRDALWAVRALDGKSAAETAAAVRPAEMRERDTSRRSRCRACRSANMSSTTIARSAFR